MDRITLYQLYFYGSTLFICLLLFAYKQWYKRWHWRVRNKMAAPVHDNVALAAAFIAVVALVALFLTLI